MRIAILTDMGGTHGMGHAVRCRALGNVLAQRGAEVLYVTSTISLRQFVAPSPCYLNPALHDGFFQDITADILIVDTKYPYGEHHFRAFGVPCMVRIDHPHATAGSCDLLVMPNAHQSHNTEWVLGHRFRERFLYGWDYVMLAPDVVNDIALPYQHRMHGPIVFCAGGSDPYAYLQRMYDLTADIGLDEGMLLFAQPPLVKIRESQKRYTSSHVLPFRRSLLRNASLVVGMFGVTPYECLYWQTPMLCMGHTPENEMGAEILAERSRGALECMRTIDQMPDGVFADVIETYWKYTKERQAMHEGAASLAIDGKGIERVADAIMKLWGNN